MTSSVTVHAHAGWDIEVTRRDTVPEGVEPARGVTDIIKDGGLKDFTIWQGNELLIREVPKHTPQPRAEGENRQRIEHGGDLSAKEPLDP